VRHIERQSIGPLVHLNDLVNPTSNYWVENIPRRGTVPYRDNPGSPYRNNASAPYMFFRNVKDYGAVGKHFLIWTFEPKLIISVGDGFTDDTDAINRAISEGPRCGSDCKSSSITPAIVYFPSVSIGIYYVVEYRSTLV